MHVIIIITAVMRFPSRSLDGRKSDFMFQRTINYYNNIILYSWRLCATSENLRVI